MAVQLRLESDTTANVESLHRWLRAEQPARQFGDLRWGGSTEPDDMGIVVDVLTLVVGSGLASAQLAVALTEWRRTRRPEPALRISTVAPDGTTTLIEASSPEALTAAIQALDRD